VPHNLVSSLYGCLNVGHTADQIVWARRQQRASDRKILQIRLRNGFRWNRAPHYLIRAAGIGRLACLHSSDCFDQWHSRPTQRRHAPRANEYVRRRYRFEPTDALTTLLCAESANRHMCWLSYRDDNGYALISPGEGRAGRARHRTGPDGIRGRPCSGGATPP